MTTAPPADQRRLLDLQALDTQLAKLAHARRTHPTIAALSELSARAEDLRRAEILAVTAVKDVRREVARAEDAVTQVRERAERDRTRLEAGQFSARDSVAVLAELDSLAARQSVLEDAELEVMERLETAESELNAIQAQQLALQADVDRTAAERDAALAELDRQSEQIAARRAVAADGVAPDLLGLYEQVRSQNSGLAVLGLRGATTEPLRLELSLSEVAAFKAAPAEEVLRDAEQGYILVRLGD